MKGRYERQLDELELLEASINCMPLEVWVALLNDDTTLEGLTEEEKARLPWNKGKANEPA